jgi:AbrB family looped-hinge helix DNA binding protein
MLESRITRSGQVTIPADIRKALGLTAGDRVVFTQAEDGTIVLRAKRRSILDLEGLLKTSKAKHRIPIGELNIGRR